MTHDTTTGGPGAVRGRPMDQSRGRELLRATQDLLMETGYDNLSMDAVAARAGSSKSTLYRRWPSKADLVAAAVEAFAWDAPVPDTGSLREDLFELAQVWFDPDHKRDRLFVRLLTALPSDDRLHEIYLSTLARPRALALAAIIERATARGEIPGSATPERVAGILPAMAFQQLVVQRAPVDREFIERILDEILLPLLGVGH